MIITAEELEKFPQDDYRYELVRGGLIRMSPVGYQHGKAVAQFMFLLQRHLHGRSLGVVVTEVGFKLASNPDTVRAPDVAFIRQERIPPPDPRGFWAGPPDFAVEVLSPDDRPLEVREKIEEYLRQGVPLALVLANLETVPVYRPSTSSTTLRAAQDLLDLGEVVPGFRCTLQRSSNRQVRHRSNLAEMVKLGPVRWSPRGDWILNRDGDRLRVVSPDGKRNRVVSELACETYGWSNDGLRILGMLGARSVGCCYSKSMWILVRRRASPTSVPCRLNSIWRSR